ncbi:MAG: hypothetical protein Q8L28_01150, partial [bacterium]|nr:hypothetical protein [bacterium]
MNDNQTTPNQPPKIPSFAQVKNNIGPLIKDVFGKLYTNKMAFYLVCGAFGLILIILIAGVIYKMSGNIGPKANATPMPVSQNQNSQIQEKELSPLDKMDNDLK